MGSHFDSGRMHRRNERLKETTSKLVRERIMERCRATVRCWKMTMPRFFESIEKAEGIPIRSMVHGGNRREYVSSSAQLTCQQPFRYSDSMMASMFKAFRFRPGTCTER